MADILQGTAFAGAVAVSTLAETAPLGAQHGKIGYEHYLFGSDGTIYSISADSKSLVGAIEAVENATFTAGTVRSSVELNSKVYFAVASGSSLLLYKFDGITVTLEATISTTSHQFAEMMSDGSDVYCLYTSQSDNATFRYRNGGAWDQTISLASLPGLKYEPGRGSVATGGFGYCIGSVGNIGGEQCEMHALKFQNGALTATQKVAVTNDVVGNGYIPVSGLVLRSTSLYFIARNHTTALQPVPAFGANLYTAAVSNFASWSLTANLNSLVSASLGVDSGDDDGSVPRRGALMSWRSALWAYLQRDSDDSLYALYKTPSGAPGSWSKAFNIDNAQGAGGVENTAFFTMLS